MAHRECVAPYDDSTRALSGSRQRRNCLKREAFGVAALVGRLASLLHSAMTEEQVQYVVQCVRQVVERARRVKIMAQELLHSRPWIKRGKCEGKSGPRNSECRVLAVLPEFVRMCDVFPKIPLDLSLRGVAGGTYAR